MTRGALSRSGRAAARGEDGFAMVVVIVTLLVAVLLAAAALAESLDSRTLTSRGGRARRGQQAADAGVQRVLYEESEANIDSWNLNGGPLGLSTVLDCMPLTLNSNLQITGFVNGGAYVNAAGVCPSTTPGSNTTYTDPLGNHAFEQAEFIPGQTNFRGGAERVYFPKIVALGWDDNGANKVYSREEAILAPVAPLQAIEGMNNVTIHGLGLLGLNVAAIVNGDVSARGTLTLPTLYAGLNLATSSGSLLATVAAPTISGSLVGTVNGGTVNASQIVQRSPITISGTKPNCPTAGCPSVNNNPGTDGYSANNDTFTMTHVNESVTFQPGDYVFCSFNVTAGTVTANPSASAPVRIFIDSPNSTRCKGKTGANGDFNAATGMNNLLEPSNPTGSTTAPSGLQIYVVGDGGGYDNTTTVNIGDAATCTNSVLGVCTQAVAAAQAMVVYAPTSAVTINTGVCVVGAPGSCTLGVAGIFDGAVIGDNVDITASTITQDLDLGNYPLYDGVTAFHPVQFIQCDASVTSLQGLNDPSPTPSDVTHDLAGC